MVVSLRDGVRPGTQDRVHVPGNRGPTAAYHVVQERYRALRTLLPAGNYCTPLDFRSHSTNQYTRAGLTLRTRLFITCKNE